MVALILIYFSLILYNTFLALDEYHISLQAVDASASGNSPNFLISVKGKQKKEVKLKIFPHIVVNGKIDIFTVIDQNITEVCKCYLLLWSCLITQCVNVVVLIVYICHLLFYVFLHRYFMHIYFVPCV